MEKQNKPLKYKSLWDYSFYIYPYDSDELGYLFTFKQLVEDYHIPPTTIHWWAYGKRIEENVVWFENKRCGIVILDDKGEVVERKIYQRT